MSGVKAVRVIRKATGQAPGRTLLVPWFVGPVICSIVIFLAGVVGLPAFAAGTQAPPGSKPNIIFILADDLGYGDLGCYGQKRIKTPNIDKLASEGMRFTDFYAGSTVCAPSRCCLMTGLHTGHAYIRGNAKISLRPEDFTVAELLKGAGYHTGLIGKWGLGSANSSGVPPKKGFDEFLGYLDQTRAHNYYPDFLDRFDPKHPEYDRSVLSDNRGGQRKVYAPDVFATASLNFVQANRPDRFNQFRPFFLYLANIIPHANNEEGQRSGNGMQVPSDAPYSSETWPQPEKNKAAMITRLDEAVGKLMEKLKALHLEENTIVFFSSDNGPHKEGGVTPEFFQSAGPLRGYKRDLYEGGIRVPLIVRWPGHIKPGQVNSLPAAFWDFLPTAAEIAGAHVDGGKTDGISLGPSLRGLTQTNRHEFLYWEFHERGFQQAVRMGDWKAVKNAMDKPLELYNLKTDPGETQNVSDQNPEVIAKIEGYLKTARVDSEEFPVRPGSAGRGSRGPAK